MFPLLKYHTKFLDNKFKSYRNQLRGFKHADDLDLAAIFRARIPDGEIVPFYPPAADAARADPAAATAPAAPAADRQQSEETPPPPPPQVTAEASEQPPPPPPENAERLPENTESNSVTEGSQPPADVKPEHSESVAEVAEKHPPKVAPHQAQESSACNDEDMEEGEVDNDRQGQGQIETQSSNDGATTTAPVQLS